MCLIRIHVNKNSCANIFDRSCIPKHFNFDINNKLYEQSDQKLFLKSVYYYYTTSVCVFILNNSKMVYLNEYIISVKTNVF